MNTNKQTTNNNDYLAKLELFFQKKIDQDKINRKIKQNKKVSKKKQNPLVFEFDSNQFRLVDKNGVASLSVARVSKKNSSEEQEKNNMIIQKNKRKILKNKYELLFEYQDIENYANIYKDNIQPLEELNKQGQAVIDAINNKTKSETETFNTTRDNIKIEIDAYKELLHNTNHQNKQDRQEIMKGYIEKQSELYALNKEYHSNIHKINEMTVKLK